MWPPWFCIFHRCPAVFAINNRAPTRGRPYDGDDSVKMVGHDHVFVNCYIWEFIR